MIFSGFEVVQKSSMEMSVEPEMELTLFFVVHSIAMLNTVTNPILYGWLNTNLKHLFRWKSSLEFFNKNHLFRFVTIQGWLNS